MFTIFSFHIIFIRKTLKLKNQFKNWKRNSYDTQLLFQCFVNIIRIIQWFEFCRYVAIVHPLKPRMSKKKAISIIVIIWVCGAIFAFPTLLYSKTYSYRYSNREIRTLCLMKWPDGVAGHSKYDNMFVFIFIHIISSDNILKVMYLLNLSCTKYF